MADAINASQNFIQQYSPTGNILGGLEAPASAISENYNNTGIYQSSNTQETGGADAANNPISLSELQGGNYNGIFIVAGGQIQSPNFISGSTGWQILSNGNVEFNAGTFRGALVANSIDIPNTTTANSFHVNSAGDTWWGATTFGSAVASISKAGAGSFSSITITGGAISGTPISAIPNSTATDISLLEFTHNLVFSVTDADTIAWASGTINLSNARTFSISSGNTGNMAALTYIYLDTAASITVLQTTTTYSSAIGANKILIAVAKNNTVTASVIVYGGGQPLIDGAQIGAASIVAGNIAALTITAAQIAATTITGANIATLNITGKSATFDTGTVGGFTMSSTTLSATNFTVTAGAANVANLSVGTGSTLAGLNAGNTGTDIAFWAGDTFANRATAPFRVTLAGEVTATNIIITGDINLPLINGVQGTEPTGYRNNTGAAGTLTAKVGKMTMALSGTAAGGEVGIDTDVAFISLAKPITFVIDFKFNQFTFTGSGAGSILLYRFLVGEQSGGTDRNSFGIKATASSAGATTLVFSVVNYDNSGTETATVVSPTVAVTNRLVCVYTPSTSIVFTLNGTVVATSTTNLPTTSVTNSELLFLDGQVQNNNISIPPTVTISRFAVVGMGLG